MLQDTPTTSPNRLRDKDSQSLEQEVISKDGSRQTIVNGDQPHILHTPNSKHKVTSHLSVFKSPAPSNLKHVNTRDGLAHCAVTTNVNLFLKSPIGSRNKSKHSNCGSNSKPGAAPSGFSGYKDHQNNTASGWIISPVCSRLRDHMYLVNGGGQGGVLPTSSRKGSG